MSDKEYLTDLHNLRGTIVREGGWKTRAIAALDHAIKRLTPQAPPPGSVKVPVVAAQVEEVANG